jgi:serine/threonine-protein phosphatase 6 regulatory subunit 3
MMLLNRSPEFDHLYDSEGRLTGNLSTLEELARVITINSEAEDQANLDADEDEMEPAAEFPVSGASRERSGLEFSDEDEDMTDDAASSDEDVMEEIDMNDSPHAATPPMSPLEDETLQHPPLIIPSSPNASSLPPASEIIAQGTTMTRGILPRTESDRSISRPPSSSSRRSTRRNTRQDPPNFVPIGDKLKKRFAETRVLTTLLVSTYIDSFEIETKRSICRIYSLHFPGTTFFMVLYTMSSIKF